MGGNGYKVYFHLRSGADVAASSSAFAIEESNLTPEGVIDGYRQERVSQIVNIEAEVEAIVRDPDDVGLIQAQGIRSGGQLSETVGIVLLMNADVICGVAGITLNAEARFTDE